MENFEVLPPYTGMLESIDSEFSLISECRPRPTTKSGSQKFSGSCRLSASVPDVSEEEIQRLLFELTEDSRLLRESLRSSNTKMKVQLDAIAMWCSTIAQNKEPMPYMPTTQATKPPRNIYSPECGKKQGGPATPKHSIKTHYPKPATTYAVKEILYILGVVLFAVAAVYFGPSFWSNIRETLPKASSAPKPPVPTIIKNLQTEFSIQPPMTFKIVNSAIHWITEHNPTNYFGLSFWSNIQETLPKDSLSSKPPVATIIKNLQTIFSEQPPMTFKIVNSSLGKLNELNPKAPAIIILLAEKGAEDIAVRFASRVGQSVSSPNRTIAISGHTYKGQDPDTAKKDIDNLINDNLVENQSGAVLVDRLDYIPVEAAMIFHTYCDHENAPFKHVVYVMTIASKKTGLKLFEPKEWDQMVQDHLYESWGTSSYDKVSSLLSRLTVSVAAIVSG